jgi:hypothetical protein
MKLRHCTTSITNLLIVVILLPLWLLTAIIALGLQSLIDPERPLFD